MTNTTWTSECPNVTRSRSPSHSTPTIQIHRNRIASNYRHRPSTVKPRRAAHFTRPTHPAILAYLPVCVCTQQAEPGSISASLTTSLSLSLPLARRENGNRRLPQTSSPICETARRRLSPSGQNVEQTLFRWRTSLFSVRESTLCGAELTMTKPNWWPHDWGFI